MLVAIILISISGTYAYFTSIANNDLAETAVLRTGTMALTFADNDNGINAKLSFGETVTKKFTIENTGTLDASLSLDFLRLQNSYLYRSLSYNLMYCETEDGEYKELIPETNMPVSSIPISSAISGEISVPAGEKYYYNLNITLNMLADKDQTADLNASFSTEFSVDRPSRYRHYTLRIDPNGGTWQTYTGPQKYLLKSEEEMTVEEPTRYGYDFVGWDMTGSSSEIKGTTFSMGISDTYLSANWNPHKITVTVDGVPREVDFGSVLDLETPIREGYTFTGWETTGGSLENNNLKIDEDADIEVTSNYAINNYKYIVYHNKMNTDGTTFTAVGKDTEESEAEYSSMINPRVKTYTGFTSPNEKTLRIQAETVYPPVLNRVDYNYTRNKYSLTINVDENSTREEVFYDATKDLGVPEKIGYDFTNWTVEGAEVEGNVIRMGIESATATANFVPANYSVTFNPNGGSTSVTSKVVEYDSTFGDMPEPTYDGYRFLGWFTDRIEGEEITPSTKVSITSNITLYAHYEEINVLMARVDNEKIWNHKEDITKVVFEPQIAAKKDATYTYDISTKQNRSVMGYLVPTETDNSKYTLYIQADGKIIANPNSSVLFGWFTNLQTIEGLENFDTSQATLMYDMFDRCYNLTSLDLSTFDTSQVTNMGHMFNDCRSLTSLIIKNFDTRNVQYMDYMFSGDVNLESLDVSSFDTSNVVNMERMFSMWIGDLSVYGKLTEIKGLENFRTPNVTNMERMFDRCGNIVNLDLSSFETGNVTNMFGMFSECSSLSKLDLKNFETSKVINMANMFDNCQSLTSVNLSSFDTSNVTNIQGMFNNCQSLAALDLSSFDTSKVVDMSYMFCHCRSLTRLDLSNFDTGNVTNMELMFNMWEDEDSQPSKLETIVFSEKFNTAKVTNMESMFSNCNSLKSLDLSSFDTRSVTNMHGMFANCFSMEILDLSNFDTNSVTNMHQMFMMWHPVAWPDSKLRSITFSKKFNTQNVTNMADMFANTKVTSLDLSSFDTGNVTNMYHMFMGCVDLTNLDLSNFDISSVTEKDGFISSVSPSIQIIVGNSTIKQWVIDISDEPKLVDSNFIIG